MAALALASVIFCQFDDAEGRPLLSADRLGFPSSHHDNGAPPAHDGTDAADHVDCGTAFVKPGAGILSAASVSLLWPVPVLPPALVIAAPQSVATRGVSCRAGATFLVGRSLVRQRVLIQI